MQPTATIKLQNGKRQREGLRINRMKKRSDATDEANFAK